MKDFLDCVSRSLAALNLDDVESVVAELRALRDRGGRLFLLGCGGGCAHAMHAASDFRTLCGIDATAVAENAAYITAAANDSSWENAYAMWLATYKPTERDAVLVLSVGGGSVRPPISVNIVNAVDVARKAGAPILGILGRDGGYTATVATAAVVIPVDRAEFTTPITEGLQSVIAHLIVTELATKKAKWESTDA